MENQHSHSSDTPNHDPEQPLETPNHEHSQALDAPHAKQSTPATDSVVTGLGTIAGGVVGAALGHAVNEKVGTAIGGVVGAIAGGVAAHQAADFAGTVIKEVQPTVGLGLGADQKPIELPKSYTWEELQALSKPQGGQHQAG
ncbi:MAG TPA: colicin V family bacteriocin [Leptolyngbya sp.]|jgi:hypothetical protein|nr:colicin V family bacteriocin [Leptolyngbya sp.]